MIIRALAWKGANMMSVKRPDILRDIPLFSCLDDDSLDGLSKVAVKKTFPSHTILLTEGDKTDSLYVICSGKVKVEISDEHGKEVILTMLGPGEYFGEMALLDGKPRSASVVTREPTEILIISRNDFRNILISNPDAVFNLLRGLLKRLREANEKIESLALMDVYGRVAKLFVQLAKPKGPKLVIGEKLTHQEIANMIGSSREMVSRILKELVTGGYITVERKVITINRKLPHSW
jgi:CRP/FNR family cyclic AMP-dependent transcriptional regulator